MKPARFRYVRPGSLPEALALLAEYCDDAKILAGGQSLMPLLNMRLAQPGVLVDLNGVRELDYLVQEDGWLRCGALVRQRTVEEHPLTEQVPLLREAVRHIGHATTRNRGTVCGSIAHADPASELPAVLLALDGRVVVAGADGESVVPAADFFLTIFTTTLAPGQLVKEVQFPLQSPAAGSAYEEFAVRCGDFGLVGVACVVEPGADGTIGDVRLALAGVGDVPYRARAVEAALVGRRLDEALAAEAGDAVAAAIDPGEDLHADAAYRKALAREYVRRALLQAGARAAWAERSGVR